MESTTTKRWPAGTVQSFSDTSPLSTPPSSPREPLTTPSSSADARVSPQTAAESGQSPPAMEMAADLTTITMEKETSPTPSVKRSREDDDNDQDSASPPKKSRTKAGPKGRSKAKAAPKKPTSEKSPAKRAARKKATPPPPPPSTRPSRYRKAPDRFEDLAQPASVEPKPVKKGPSKVFDPTYITTNSTSRLVKADVYHMLLEPAAWTALSAEQQKTLLSMLPASEANTVLINRVESGDTQDTRPQAFTISNDCFRTDVAKFKEDLKNGHLAKTWQNAAQQAVVARAAGEYDEWKAQEAELWWGQKGTTGS